MHSNGKVALLSSSDAHVLNLPTFLVISALIFNLDNSSESTIYSQNESKAEVKSWLLITLTTILFLVFSMMICNALGSTPQN